MVQDGLQEAFWIDFGWRLGGIEEGLGRDLGGSWEDFTPKTGASLMPPSFCLNFIPISILECSGKALEGFWEGFGKVFKKFSMSGPPRCLAKPRGASQYWPDFGCRAEYWGVQSGFGLDDENASVQPFAARSSTNSVQLKSKESPEGALK